MALVAALAPLALRGFRGVDWGSPEGLRILLLFLGLLLLVGLRYGRYWAWAWIQIIWLAQVPLSLVRMADAYVADQTLAAALEAAATATVVSLLLLYMHKKSVRAFCSAPGPGRRTVEYLRRRRHMAKLFIEDLDVWGKRALTRVDFNVPLDENLNVTDTTRIVAALPTIEYIIENGGKAILMSHLGRPKGKVKEELRLKPAAVELGKLLGQDVTMAPDCIGPEVERIVNEMAEGDIVVLENLRFHAEEEANDPAFCEALARLGDVYVNDAFGTAHRAHASTVGVTKYFDQCASGYLMRKEVEFLGEALAEPNRPFVAILGGAKVSTKIGVMESLMEKADDLLIGGAMTYTFQRAMGKSTGTSLVEEDKIELAKEILEKAKAKGVNLVFPMDLVVANAFEDDAERKVVPADEIPEGWMGMDIGPKTVEEFGEYIEDAETILWNGPVGVFEKPNFAKGTFAIAKMIAESGAISIVGGGDSASAIQMSGVADKISHISTGGGASLEYIELGTLPGIEALTDRPE